MRSLLFVPQAWEQYTYWQGQDRKTLKRINLLLEAVSRDPFDGPGKPEPLVGSLAGYWSRRIDEVNRLVCRATDTEIVVISCRYHYER